MAVTYDVVGVGFGPSNLALAIALTEPGPAEEISSVFVEKQSGFGWHRGMLIEDATMQVSFLKDLVTLRNPTSGFSFVSYLHDRGRLVDFINHKLLFPTRVEFHDYLRWAADRLAHLVRYDTEVVGVRPATGADERDALEVLVRTGEHTEVLRARNVVLASGLQPVLPDGFTASDRVWHSRDLLTRLARGVPGQPRSFTVVGAGQSAAEVTAHLHERFPEAEVHAVFSRYGYSPADDSPFANRIFDPAAVDVYYQAPPNVKQLLLGYHANTNYSVVDQELIEELYRRAYQEKVTGRQRLRIRGASRVRELHGDADGVSVVVEDLASGRRSTHRSDVVVCATGYRQMDPTALLGPLADQCKRDDRGRLRVDRDYRVVTTGDARWGIYLQGGTEHTHGISSSLLSNTAVRAGEIADALVQQVGAHQDRARQDRAQQVGV